MLRKFGLGMFGASELARQRFAGSPSAAATMSKIPNCLEMFSFVVDIELLISLSRRKCQRAWHENLQGLECLDEELTGLGPMPLP
jgi:hypothetical protein